MGLFAAAAAVPADPDPLPRAGADGAARHGHRQGPRGADLETFRPGLGLGFGRDADRLVPRRAADGIFRTHRRRRADGCAVVADARPGRHRADDDGGHAQLSFGREDRDFGRPVRTRVPRRRLARASRAWRGRRRRAEDADPRSEISLSRLRQCRRGDHAVDGVLPAGLDRRAPAVDGRHRARARGSPRRSRRSSARLGARFCSGSACSAPRWSPRSSSR